MNKPWMISYRDKHKDQVIRKACWEAKQWFIKEFPRKEATLTTVVKRLIDQRRLAWIAFTLSKISLNATTEVRKNKVIDIQKEYIQKYSDAHPRAEWPADRCRMDGYGRYNPFGIMTYTVGPHIDALHKDDLLIPMVKAIEAKLKSQHRR